ncbi:hypothetical protein TNCV_3048991 [Trichonephila clavipes]|nr:hypothetical protein TNCV_3048991 [Trichonephila clavipes]
MVSTLPKWSPMSLKWSPKMIKLCFYRQDFAKFPLNRHFNSKPNITLEKSLKRHFVRQTIHGDHDHGSQVVMITNSWPNLRVVVSSPGAPPWEGARSAFVSVE